MRSQRKRARCRGCEELREYVGPLSARGLCADCGVRRMAERVAAGTPRDAEWWRAWREGVLRSAGVVVLDDAGDDSA